MEDHLKPNLCYNLIEILGGNTMPQDIKIWRIVDNNLREAKKLRLKSEERLENWLEKDISMLSDGLFVIGRQVKTDFGGFIDLLCLDRNGDIVIVELKRDKTPRESTAQAIDYASWVSTLSNEKITDIANEYLKDKGPLEKAFKIKFGLELPDILNERHKIMILGSDIDASSERIIIYLSNSYGVNINAATFQYFQDDNEKEYLARVFLIEPGQVEYLSDTIPATKRKPNLTFEALLGIADQKDVGSLYRRFVDELTRYFDYIGTTRSSIAFIGNMSGSRNTIFSLIPEESNSKEGLRFQIYINRFAEYFEIEKKEAIQLLPNKKEEWEAYRNAPASHVGFAGFFRNIEEIDRFLVKIAELKK